MPLQRIPLMEVLAKILYLLVVVFPLIFMFPKKRDDSLPPFEKNNTLAVLSLLITPPVLFLININSLLQQPKQFVPNISSSPIAPHKESRSRNTSRTITLFMVKSGSRTARFKTNYVTSLELEHIIRFWLNDTFKLYLTCHGR